MHDLAGKRVTVMGLGRFGGGVGVTRFLVAQGADVLVTDTDSVEQLADSVKQLAGLPVEFRLGEHNASDFTTCDLVVANPAVKPDNRFLRAAEAANVPVTTEIRLLVERLPNRRKTIGVTGSAGKSTVSAMIAHILRKASGGPSQLQRAGEPPRVHLGGNIGGSLLDSLDRIAPDDWIVLELSSFQLHHLREHAPFRGWSPHIAVVTNLSPNHLDWHGSFEDYADAKRTILRYQQPGDFAELGPGLDDWSVVGFACHHEALYTRTDLLLPGEHNQLNAQLALAAAALAEPAAASLPGPLADFPGLPHRLQFVAEVNGVKCYNDSKSTTPEAAILAIDAFPPGTVHVILGGYDKGSDLTALARHAVQRCAALYTLGVTGPALAEAASAAGPTHPARPTTCGGVAWPDPRAAVVPCNDLDTAVARALHRAAPGQVVLLSPGCASWDQFTHYEARGERFIQLVTAAG